MAPTIENISAITLRVLNMKAGSEYESLGPVLSQCARHGTAYGGERASFSSLRANNSEAAILNLDQGDSVRQRGRLVFHVSDVDSLWSHLREKGFNPEVPRDASWGERYFHMLDPDGHELSFARAERTWPDPGRVAPSW
jgi:hypothetical protein